MTTEHEATTVSFATAPSTSTSIHQEEEEEEREERRFTSGGFQHENSADWPSPTVCNACLKAMHLVNEQEKEFFHFFHVFCHKTWSAHNTRNHSHEAKETNSCGFKGIPSSPGTVLALALLYTRLFVAFLHRHQSQLQTLQQPTQQPKMQQYNQTVDENDKSSQIAVGASTSITENSDDDDDSDDDNAPAVRKAQTLAAAAMAATKVELSPKVASRVYRIVNDLAAVHDVLLGSSCTFSWTDWNVASVCVEAHDFVVESLQQSKLRKAWKLVVHQQALVLQQQQQAQDDSTILTNNFNALVTRERDMFFIFCEKTTKWMAAQVVHAVEAHYDFLFLWGQVVVDDTVAEKGEPQQIQLQRQQHLRHKRQQLLDLTKLKWQPMVPTGPLPHHDVTPNEEARRVRFTLWKLAVFFRLFQQQQQNQCIPSRRQRLIASASAFALVIGLQRLAVVDDAPGQYEQQQELERKDDGKDDENNNNHNSELMNRASKTNESRGSNNDDIECLAALFEAANKECAIRRWACTLDQQRMVDQDINAHEIVEHTLILAKSVASLFAQSSQPREDPHYSSAPCCWQSKDSWLNELQACVGSNSAALFWNLPTVAADLLDTFSRQLRREKTKVEAAFFYDEIGIVNADHCHVQVLCNIFLDPPLSTVQGSNSSKDNDEMAIGVQDVVPMVEHDEVPRFTAAATVIQNGADTTGVQEPIEGRTDRPEQVVVSKRRKIQSNCSPDVENRSFSLKNGTPCVITESMELTEWTVSLLSMEHVQPSGRLRDLLVVASASAISRGGVSRKEGSAWAEVIIPILNTALLLLSQEGLMGKTTSKPAVSVQSSMQDGESGVGRVVIAAGGAPGTDLAHEQALCRALVAFYYHALECILLLQKQQEENSHERKCAGDTFDPLFAILDVDMHRALLAWCAMCVVKAVSITKNIRLNSDITSIQVYQVLSVCDANPYYVLKISELFVRAVSSTEGSDDIHRINSNKSTNDINTKKRKNVGRSPLMDGMPRILRHDFERYETSLLESLVFSRDPRFGMSLSALLGGFEERTAASTAMIADGGQGIIWWPVEALYPSLSEELIDENEEFPPLATVRFPAPDLEGFEEYKTVSQIIGKVLRKSHERIVALCASLDIPSTSPLARLVWISFRQMMRTQIDLFFDRHIDHWILCCFYGVAKQIRSQPEVLFVKLVDAYLDIRGPEIGEVACQRIVRNIRLDLSEDFGSISINSNSNGSGISGTGNHQWGDIILLYNKVFVPVMKKYLIHSQSFQLATM